MEYQVITLFFRIGAILRNILSTVLPGKRFILTFSPFLFNIFSCRPETIESPAIIHVSFQLQAEIIYFHDFDLFP